MREDLLFKITLAYQTHKQTLWAAHMVLGTLAQLPGLWILQGLLLYSEPTHGILHKNVSSISHVNNFTKFEKYERVLPTE